MLGVGRWGPLGPSRSQTADGPEMDAGPGDGSRIGADGEERRSWIALAAADQVGPVTFDDLVATFGSARRVLELARGPGGRERLLAARSAAGDPGGRLTAPAASAIADAANRMDDILARLDRGGLAAVTRLDPHYPTRLRGIEASPPALFVQGDIASLDRACAVAVVGTRRPTWSGRVAAARIAAALARVDAIVVSGLAVGIDGAAHEAVVATGGRTVAVIGGAHDRLSPAVHGRLAAAIIGSGGAVVSEYAPGTEPSRGTFPRRNRIISGLVSAVVVVEAGARSGALSTASWALEQGRDCFVVPGPIDAPQSAGCLGFLREWPGLVRVVAGIPQLLEDLGFAAAAAFDRPIDELAGATRLPDGGPPARVAAALISGAVTVDELVAMTGLPVGAVLVAIGRLETAGLVAGSFGRYRPAGSLAAAAAPRARAP